MAKKKQMKFTTRGTKLIEPAKEKKKKGPKFKVQKPTTKVGRKSMRKVRGR